MGGLSYHLHVVTDAVPLLHCEINMRACRLVFYRVWSEAERFMQKIGAEESEPGSNVSSCLVFRGVSSGPAGGLQISLSAVGRLPFRVLCRDNLRKQGAHRTKAGME